MQIVIQLPEDEAEALACLEYAKTLLRFAGGDGGKAENAGDGVVAFRRPAV